MTMGFMWFTLILYCVCQNRLHFVHVCLHISCMLFFDVFVFVCMCVSVCVCVCFGLFVCLLVFFFVCWFVCLVRFGYWFGFVCLLVWFGLFISLDCLLVAWFCCCFCCSCYCWWCYFPLSHEWDIWINFSHGPGSSENLQLHVESEEFNFSMSPGWSVGLQFFASKITDTTNVLARVVVWWEV